MSVGFSLDDLRVVLSVARHESFVRAARETGSAPSNVSRAVARLEEQLGMRIFARNSRRVSLTADGSSLIERTAPLLRELDDRIERATQSTTDLRGSLRVTAPTASGAGGVATALLAFGEAYPRIALELTLTNQVIDLVRDGYDLAFRVAPIAGEGLVTRRVWQVSYALGASASFAKAHLATAPVLTRREAETLPAIVTRRGAVWRFSLPAGSSIELQPNVRLIVNDLRVAIEAAHRGLGLVRAPREMLAAAGLMLLRPVDELGALVPRELHAVYPSRRQLPKRVRLAINWVEHAMQPTQIKGVDGASSEERGAPEYIPP